MRMETVLLEGHPDSEVIGFAEKNDTGPIVTGTPGRTALERAILASVALALPDM